MKSGPLLVLGTLCLSAFVAPQSSDDILMMKMDAAIRKMEALTQTIEVMDEKVTSALKDIQQLGQDISDFQSLFTTDECANGSHDCSPQASCKDTLVLFSCDCLPGYHGDGVTCEDVDECSTSANRCHSQANCTNVEGDYLCTCKTGFSGDGIYCEADKPCVSPSHFFPSLGCITPVAAGMTWDEARDNCKGMGLQLLEGITSQAQLLQFHEPLGSFLKTRFGSYNAWLGIRGGRWLEEGNPVDGDASPPLWRSGEPDDGDTACGYARLDSTPYLFDSTGCGASLGSLCQRK